MRQSLRVSMVILWGSLLVFLSCRPRADSVLSSDDDRQQSNPAWFVGGDRVIATCLRTSKDVTSRLAKAHLTERDLQSEILASYTRWIQYLTDRRAIPLLDKPTAEKLVQRGFQSGINAGKFSAKNSVLRVYDILQPPRLMLPSLNGPSEKDIAAMFPLALVFMSDCKKADLEVDLGVPPVTPNVDRFHAEPNSVLGEVLLTKHENQISTWQQGAMVLKGHSDLLSYQDLVEPSILMIHEWGHILGNPHVDGTIMDPSELKKFSDHARLTRDLDAKLRQLILGDVRDIDHWRQLYVENDCVENFRCRVFGLGFFDVTGDVLFNYKGAVRDLEYLSIDFFEVLVNHGLDVIGKSTVEFEQKIAPIFQRPRAVVSNPLFHESYVSTNWRTATYMTRIFQNTNADDSSSPLQITAECQTEKVTLFEAPFLQGNVQRNNRQWTKSMATDTLENILRAQRCAKGIPDYSHLANDRSIADARESIAWLKTTMPWNFGNPTDQQSWKLPAAESMCGLLRDGVQLCVWRRGLYGVAQFSTAAGSATTKLSPYSKKDLPKDGSIAEGWQGSMPWQGGGSTATFRLGFRQSQSTKVHANADFELDIAYEKGVWYRAVSGQLAQAEKR